MRDSQIAHVHVFVNDRSIRTSAVGVERSEFFRHRMFPDGFSGSSVDAAEQSADTLSEHMPRRRVTDDRVTAHGEHAARKFGFGYATTDEAKIVEDDAINTVVVALDVTVFLVKVAVLNVTGRKKANVFAPIFQFL